MRHLIWPLIRQRTSRTMSSTEQALPGAPLGRLLFAPLFATLRADGELTVLLTPDSLIWSGDDPLESISLIDVLMATQGYAVSGGNDWSGLSIKDPFTLDQLILILLHVQGVYNVPTLERIKVYELLNSYTEPALDNFVGQLEPESVQNFTFYDHDIGVAMCQHLLGETDVPTVKPIRYLKPLEYSHHSNFLIELGNLKAIAGNFPRLLKRFRVLDIRMSLERIAKVKKNVLLHEAKTLLAETIDLMMQSVQNITDDVLVLLTTEKYPMKNNATFKGFKTYNVSNPFGEFQSIDYPVLFNIVVWFCLAMAFSLAVICYVIATIDPGRDSVIYRATRTVKNPMVAKKKR